MGRLLLILAIVFAVLWLLRRALAGPRKSGAAGQAPGAPGGDLVSCAHCGVNLPKSEARSAGGRHYCSEEHWRAGPREG
jgi:uncharacterized protein